MVQPTQTRISAADYYQLPEYEQHDLIQLIDGEVVIGMPPVPRHQAIVGAVFFLLLTIARQRGGKAFVSPVEVYLDEHNICKPDVLYLSPDSRCSIGEKRLTGAPDLVVEVLSPSTAKYGRQQSIRHMNGTVWVNTGSLTPCMRSSRCGRWMRGGLTVRGLMLGKIPSHLVFWARQSA